MAGPALIAAGALLWATDAIFRYSAIHALDPLVVVFMEHLLATALILAPLLTHYRSNFLRLSAKSWLAVGFIGIGGSALATLFFTSAFRYINPSIVILLQKTQPILVLLLSVTLLRERPARRFYGWAGVALGSTIVLAYPDFDFGFLSRGIDFRSRGVLYALGASMIWALCTVAGRILLRETPPLVATFWRFTFGLATLTGILAVTPVDVPWAVVSQTPVLRSLAYMAFFSGLLAMLLYYFGLRKTEASTATIVELIFPLGAVALNTLFLNAPLDRVQIAAGAVLLFAVTRISMRF